MLKKSLSLFLLLLSLSLPVQAQESITAPSSRAKALVAEGKRLFHGEGLTQNRDLAAAFEHFKKAAELEHPEAYYYLGIMYQQGLEVLPSEALAERMYRQAAELGYPEAQMLVGIMHIFEAIEAEETPDIQQNLYREALDFLRPAAESGIAEAKFWYGDLLVKGLGTEKKVEKGVSLVREAAEAGNPNGQNMLAAYYWLGTGMEQDLEKAYQWAYISAENGNENAPALMRRLIPHMTAEQLEAATEAAITEAEAQPEKNKPRTPPLPIGMFNR